MPSDSTDMTALVERLNNKWKHSEEDCYAAASAPQAQAAEIVRWKRKADTLKQLADADHERAETAERERDEARAALERIRHEAIIRQPATAVQTVADIRLIADAALGGTNAE